MTASASIGSEPIGSDGDEDGSVATRGRAVVTVSNVYRATVSVTEVFRATVTVELLMSVIGNLVRTSVVFTEVATGTPMDPTPASLQVRTPDGTETTYVYGVEGSPIARDGLGTFHADFIETQANRWRFRWVGSGAVIAAGEKPFDVGPSGMANPVMGS